MEEDNVQLDGVVVSANRSEIARKMAPTLVNVVSMDTYDRVNATTLRIISMTICGAMTG